MTTRRGITGRDGWIIARALYVAARKLKTDEMPAYSDAEDMQKILVELYPGLANSFKQQDDFFRAYQLGYEARGKECSITGEYYPIDSKEVRDWLARNDPTYGSDPD